MLKKLLQAISLIGLVTANAHASEPGVFDSAETHGIWLSAMLPPVQYELPEYRIGMPINRALPYLCITGLPCLQAYDAIDLSPGQVATITDWRPPYSFRLAGLTTGDEYLASITSHDSRADASLPPLQGWIADGHGLVSNSADALLRFSASGNGDTYLLLEGTMWSDVTYTVSVSPVPEPATWASLLAGILVVTAWGRKRRS